MKPLHAFIGAAVFMVLPSYSFADLGPIVVTPTRTVQPQNNSSAPKIVRGDNANQFGKLGSTSVYNEGLAYEFKAWQVNFRINNVFDENYAEFVPNNGFGAAFQPSPGRNYSLTSNFRFK